MKKIKINEMTKTQLEYAFAKVAGLMMGEDTVVFNNEQKTLSVYNLRRFNLHNERSLLNLVLTQREEVIDCYQEGSLFIAISGKVRAEAEHEVSAIIKCFLQKHLESSSYYLEIPKNIG